MGSKRTKRIKRMKQLKLLLYAVVCVALLLAGKTPAAAATEAAYEYNVKRGEDEVYRGVVNTDELNVRTAAGKKNPVVKVNEKGVKLNRKDEVAILDKTSSSGETWYKVSFRMGGALVIGYVYGSYVELTKDVVTPIPTIALESTIDLQEEKSGEGIPLIVLWIIGILIVFIIICIIICKKDNGKVYNGKGYDGKGHDDDDARWYDDDGFYCNGSSTGCC